MVSELLKSDKELRFGPTRVELDASKLPFPEGYLGRKPPKYNRHLQDHENTEYAQNQTQEGKEKRGGLAGEDKPNRGNKDGIRRQIIRQEAVVITDS